MFWLGLALPVCFVAGITGATIPTQLPLLSAVLPLALWRHGRITPWHGLGVIFLAYAAASLAWTHDSFTGLFGFWQIVLWALAFWLGSTTNNLSPLWRGLAVGLGISSLVAVAQAAGWTNLPSAYYPGGLLFNGAVQAAMIALVTLALIADRAWPYIPAMLPGLWLAHSRGGWLVLMAGLAGRLHWILAALLAIAATGAPLILSGPTDALRVQAWRAAAGGLSLTGYGAGSFLDVIYGTVHPEYAHNDYLQLAFEFGIGVVPIYLIAARALCRTGERYWPVFVGFAALSLFFFPLYCPSLAFVGAVVAGHILRRDDGIRIAGSLRRSALLARLYRTQPGDAAAWSSPVSVSSRNPPAIIGGLNAAL